MNNKIVWLVVGIIVLVVVVGAIVGQTKAPVESVKIGVILPLTGGQAKVGADAKIGLEIAQADLLDSNITMIFEDDAILTESIFDDISRLFPKLPADWGVWVLGYYKENLIYEPYHVKPWNHVYKFTAAHAYLITREAAKKLLADALPIESHVDHYIGDVGMVSKILVLEHPDINIEYLKQFREYV
jgi:hypothetical protein